MARKAFTVSKKMEKQWLQMWPHNPEFWPEAMRKKYEAEGKLPDKEKVGRPRSRKLKWEDLDLSKVESLVPDIARAKKDLVFFTRQFLKVVDKGGHIVPFEPWAEQLQIMEAAQAQFDAGKPIRLWVLKPRQIGSSTACAAIVFWLALFNDTYNCRVVAHDRKASATIFKHFHRFRTNLPLETLVLPGEKSRTAVSFDTFLINDLAEGVLPDIDVEDPPKPNYELASRIGIEVVSPTMGRGDAIQALWCSEFAFWVRGGEDLAPDAYGAARQSVPEEPGTCIIVESTANGMGGMFYDGYWEAEEGKSDFKALFFPWYEHSEYNFKGIDLIEADKPKDGYENWLASIPGVSPSHIVWRRWAIREKCRGDENLFRQEYPATAKEAFLAKGLPVFDPQSLLDLEKLAKENLPTLEGDFFGSLTPLEAEGGPLKVWVPPDPKAVYCLGADVAQGVRGGDYSVAYVRDIVTGQYCAAYRGRMDVDGFTEALDKLGRYYNMAMIGVEANPGGGGLYVNRRLMEKYEYPNMMVTSSVVGVGEMMQDRIGWWTHQENRENMILTLSSAVKHGIIKVFDTVFIEEAKRFHRDAKTGKPGPISGHDDCVMAAAITEQVAQRTTPYDIPAVKPKYQNWLAGYIERYTKRMDAGDDKGVDLLDTPANFELEDM